MKKKYSQSNRGGREIDHAWGMNKNIVPRVLWENRGERCSRAGVGWREVSRKEVFLEEVRPQVPYRRGKVCLKLCLLLTSSAVLLISHGLCHRFMEYVLPSP